MRDMKSPRPPLQFSFLRSVSKRHRSRRCSVSCSSRARGGYAGPGKAGKLGAAHREDVQIFSGQSPYELGGGQACALNPASTISTRRVVRSGLPAAATGARRRRRDRRFGGGQCFARNAEGSPRQGRVRRHSGLSENNPAYRIGRARDRGFCSDERTHNIGCRVPI